MQGVVHGTELAQADACAGDGVETSGVVVGAGVQLDAQDLAVRGAELADVVVHAEELELAGRVVSGEPADAGGLAGGGLGGDGTCEEGGQGAEQHGDGGIGGSVGVGGLHGFSVCRLWFRVLFSTDLQSELWGHAGIVQ